MSELNDEDLVDYEEDEALETKGQDEVKKGGTYSGIHASGFRDFLLKPELLRAVVDCGFERLCLAFRIDFRGRPKTRAVARGPSDRPSTDAKS